MLICAKASKIEAQAPACVFIYEYIEARAAVWKNEAKVTLTLIDKDAPRLMHQEYIRAMNLKKKEIFKNVALLITTAAFAVAIGANIPHFIRHSRISFKVHDYSAHVVNMPYRLTLYGTTTCPHCVAARTYLNEAHIPFNDMIIDKSGIAAQRFLSLKESGVPVLVAADRLVAGFNQDAYDELNKAANN